VSRRIGIVAALPDVDRIEVTAKLQRLVQWLAIACGITKVDLKAAIDATDDWIDANQASFNTALPTAARNGLNLTQKTLIFCYVAMKRAGILP
jgi:hypothetical protein